MKNLLTKLAIAGSGVALLAGVTYANVGNDHTGYNSDNQASVTAKNIAKITSDNDYDVHNGITAKADTGDNKAEKNTGDGSVDTGSTDLSVDLTNKGNMITNSLDGMGDMAGSYSATNSTTGADSTNKAWVKTNNSLTVTNNNDADVKNCINLTSNTGDNKASFNTGDGSVSTGDASVSVTIDNNLNTSSTTVH